MSITVYNPGEVNVAEKVVVNVMPALVSADLSAVTVAEWNAGKTIELATEVFGSSTDVSTISRRKLGEAVSREYRGTATYSVEDTVVEWGDPQTANAFLDSIVEGNTYYIGVRPGLLRSTAAAAAQKVWVYKVEALSVDPEPLNTEDGTTFQARIKWAVKGRNLKAAITA